jgi:hypothetical protein
MKNDGWEAAIGGRFPPADDAVADRDTRFDVAVRQDRVVSDTSGVRGGNRR